MIKCVRRKKPTVLDTKPEYISPIQKVIAPREERHREEGPGKERYIEWHPLLDGVLLTRDGRLGFGRVSKALAIRRERRGELKKFATSKKLLATSQ